MATRDDVARLAGVSSSTVSYVISGRRPISEETKQRVRQAMEDLNYTPNAFARGLAGSRLGLIAIHYPFSPEGVPSTEFEYVSAMAHRAREKGYHLLLWTQPIEDTAGLRSLVHQKMVDGVVLMEVMPEDPRVGIMRESGVPFVLVGRPDNCDDIPYVDNDYEDQALQTMSYLDQLGHHEILFIGPVTEPGVRGFGPNTRMRRSLKRGAEQYGIHMTVWAMERTPAAGREAFYRLMEMEPRPTAVISFNESAAAGLSNTDAIGGVSVPDDLTILGLSMGSTAADLMLPPMTTLSPSPVTLMNKAMDTLDDMIGHESDRTVQFLVRPVLTIRDSSAPRRL